MNDKGNRSWILWMVVEQCILCTNNEYIEGGSAPPGGETVCQQVLVWWTS